MVRMLVARSLCALSLSPAPVCVVPPNVSLLPRHHHHPVSVCHVTIITCLCMPPHHHHPVSVCHVTIITLSLYATSPSSPCLCMPRHHHHPVFVCHVTIIALSLHTEQAVRGASRFPLRRGAACDGGSDARHPIPLQGQATVLFVGEPGPPAAVMTIIEYIKTTIVANMIGRERANRALIGCDSQ